MLNKKFFTLLLALTMCFALLGTGMTFSQAKADDEASLDLSATYGFIDVPYYVGNFVMGKDADWYDLGYVSINAKYTQGFMTNNASANYGLLDFDTYNSDSQSLSKSDVATLLMANWKYTFAANTSVVVAIKSNANVAVSFDFTLGAGWIDWNSLLRIYHYSKADGSLSLKKELWHNEAAFTADAADITVNTKTGDVVYVEFGAGAAERCYESMSVATYKVSPQDADVATLSLAAKSVANNLLKGYNKDLYTAEDWATLTGYVSSFRDGEYESEEALVAAYNNAAANIANVPANALNVAKDDAKDQVKAAYSAKVAAHYTEADWAVIANAKSAFDAGIDACEDAEAVSALLASTLEALDSVSESAVLVKYVALCAQLKAVYNSKSEASMSADDWTKVCNAYNGFVENAKNLESEEAVQAAYDSALADIESAKVVKQSVKYLDLPSKINAANYGWVEGDVVDYTAYTGSVKNGPVPFDANDGEHKLYKEAVGKVALLENWRWFTTVDNGIIVAYKAKADLKLSVVCTRMANGGGVGWTSDTYFATYISRNGEIKEIKRVNAPSSDADFSGEYYLKAGDILYFEFNSDIIDVGSQRNTETPYATVANFDATAFDEDKYIEQNHDLSKEVTELIEAKHAALVAYVAGLNESDYSATNWMNINDYVDSFAKRCEKEVDTTADVEALYESVLAEIKAVKSLSQAAAELQETLNGYADEVVAAYNKLLADNKYTNETKAELKKICDDAVVSIKSAKSKAAGNSAKITAINSMNAITPDGTSGGGCPVAMDTMSMLVMLLIPAMVVFFAQKRRSLAK